MTAFVTGLVVGAVVVLLGVIGGLSLEITRTVASERKRRWAAQNAQPICGCKHHYSFHDEGGLCRWVARDSYDRVDHRCGCQRYIGPRLAEEIP